MEPKTIAKFYRIMIGFHFVLFFMVTIGYLSMPDSRGVDLSSWAGVVVVIGVLQMLLDWIVSCKVKETRRVLVRTVFMLLEGWAALFCTVMLNLLFYFSSPRKTVELDAIVAIFAVGLITIIVFELIRVRNKMSDIGFVGDFNECEREVVLLWKKRGFVSLRNSSSLARWNDKLLNYIVMSVAPIGMGGVIVSTRFLANSAGPVYVCFFITILITPITYTFWSRAAINLYVNLYKILQVELRTGKPVVYDKYPDVFRGLIGSDEF
jgi:hypothetical protein